MRIKMLDAGWVAREAGPPVALLRGAVGSEASVGLLPPLGDEEPAAYWRSVSGAVEDCGRRHGRTTLVLDTRHRSSECQYAAMGYRCAGIIPEYARSADGTLHATAIYDKLLLS